MTRLARARLGLLIVLLLPVWPAPAAADVGPGGSTWNVEWLGNVAMADPAGGSAAGVTEGGRLVGDRFYATIWGRGLVIYDVSDPMQPRLEGSLPLVHVVENEDLATNGEIALISQLSAVRQLDRDVEAVAPDASPSQVSLLHVVDVRDPSAPTLLATVPGAGDHTMSCLMDCTWAYGSLGTIVDLRDPSAPRLLDRRWTDGIIAVGPGGSAGNLAHDLTEVRPGVALVAAEPMVLLDVRDPADPQLRGRGAEGGFTFHNAAWARGGRDRLLVTARENSAPRCELRSVADNGLQVWDARTWLQGTGPLDTYQVRNGTYVDGQPAAGGHIQGYGCSAHWFDLHPDWRNGGALVEASYDHGMRLLRVARDGQITETGWYLPWGGTVLGAYWITDEIVYTFDAQRGIDILRVDLDGPLPPPSAAPAVAPVAVMPAPIAWSCRLPRPTT